MKKLRGILATLSVIGVGFLGLFAVQVSADVDKVAAAECTNGTKYTDFDGSYSGRDTMTVWTAGNKPLCKDVKVNFSSFTIHNTYNGQGFKNNPTALPQTLFANKTVTLKKGTTGKTTVTVSVPDACKDYQIDAYIGPVQTKITTNEGLVNTTAIVAKLFQRSKSDCSPKTVKVCDPATGKIISVPAADADKYKPADDAACKSVKVCNPKTGQIITVPASDADKYKPADDAACKSTKVCDPATGKIITVKKSVADEYKPADDAACKPVKVCDPDTGKIITVKASNKDNYKPADDAACQNITVCRLSSKTVVTIKASAYDSSKYSKNLDNCKPVTPHKMHVCNPVTGEIIQVDEDDADNYKPASDAACKSVEVCDPASGDIITVKKAKEDNYKPADDAACEEEVMGETTETPSTPTTVVYETETVAPKEIPSTGPEQAMTALVGAGSLVGAGTAYLRSRRALYK